ncbi:Guanine nucleotide exchange factor rei-2 [Trichostrongylus colubriformis]|uniref:Guanine nucleotide exchange factor rei-2 n=1 Tax=Trichostrongylus colubriformis TaxID=6319 RepID=A0AAN8FBB6_TRICO
MPEVDDNDAMRILGNDNSKTFSVRSDSCADSMLNFSELEDDDSPLDQKHLNLVHEELEKLNIATDVINKLEVQLDGARECFREIQASWSEKLKDLSKKYSSAIAKARPYYEAKIQERKLRDESQRAAIRFKRATSLLAVAKQQVALTQDSLNRETAVHPECLEVLNHHIQRVNEAEQERVVSGNEHRAISEKMMALADRIRKMEKDHRSSIKKSRTYFDQRLEFTRVLERQKELILRLEAEVRQKKCDYTTSLRNLERISDSIHEQRSISGCDSGSARDPPANPPPYQPTAPPPYEDDDGRYNISHETDDVIDPVLCLMSEHGYGDWPQRPRGLGSGVILLAQQLIGGGPSKKEELEESTSHSAHLNSPSPPDVSYRTLPQGIPNSPSDLIGTSSDASSLASVRTSGLGFTDDEALSGMLRSHSTLIQEIECATERVDNMLRRSVSDAGNGTKDVSTTAV